MFIATLDFGSFVFQEDINELIGVIEKAGYEIKKVEEPNSYDINKPD